jgi:hypothetical protein
MMLSCRPDTRCCRAEFQHEREPTKSLGKDRGRLGRNCDVTLSIPRDLLRFTAIHRRDAIDAKWLVSQQ